MTPASYLMGRCLVKIPYIGLVNIVAGKGIVPEFIQYEANPRNIIRALKPMLTDETEIRKIKKELSRVSDALGERGASEKVASIAQKMMS